VRDGDCGAQGVHAGRGVCLGATVPGGGRASAAGGGRREEGGRGVDGRRLRHVTATEGVVGGGEANGEAVWWICLGAPATAGPSVGRAGLGRARGGWPKFLGVTAGDAV